MEKSNSRKSSNLDYLWSILMIICISLLATHLVITSKLSASENDQIIKRTFVSRNAP